MYRMMNYEGFTNSNLALVEVLFLILAGGTMKTHKKPWPDNLHLDRD